MVSPSYRIFKSKDENVLLSEYLMMWFRRPEFDRYARFKSHGSAHEFFDYEEMCEVELPIPSIDKQREIVKEYNTIVNRIQLNEQLNQKLEETGQAIYKQWFVDFEFPDKEGKPYKSNGGEMEYNEELEKDVPRGWEVKSLRGLSSYINRGITPNYTKDSGIIVINQKCVRNNTIDFTFARLHDPRFREIGQERFLRKYDILVNSTGAGTLGRVGLIKYDSKRTIVDTHITIVRAESNVDPLFLWFSLLPRTSDIENLAEGSTGQTELGRENLGQLRLIFPKEDIQNKFGQIVKAYVNHSSIIDNEIPALSELRDTILQKISKVESLISENA
jgi:type I restriction enzyme S subunit